MDWILVIIISISGLVKSVNVEQLEGFHSKEACEAAVEQIKEVYTRESTFLCIPTYEIPEAH